MKNTKARPKGLINLDNNSPEWVKAKEYFAKNPKATHFKKDKANTHHSFVKVTNVIDGKEQTKIFVLQVGKALGEGGFGKVRLAQDENGFNYAIKIEGRTKRAEDDSELEILKELKEYHGEAVRILKDGEKRFKQSSVKLYTALDLVEGKSVNDSLYEARVVGQVGALEYAILCAKQIKRLHEMRIVHGDVQSANFMANRNNDILTVSDIDRGLSAIIPKGKDHIDVPRPLMSLWSAPEEKSIRSYTADIYSLGYMINNHFGLKHDPDVTAITEKMMEHQRNERLSLDEAISQLEAVYNKKLESGAKHRLTANELIEHIESNFDAYLVSMKSIDEQPGLSFQENEFRSIHINEIRKAFTKVFKSKGYNVEFEVGDNTNEIRLNTDNGKIFLEQIAKNYNNSAAVDTSVKKGLDYLNSQTQALSQRIKVIEEDIKTAVDSQNIDNVNKGLDALRKLVEQELEPHYTKIANLGINPVAFKRQIKEFNLNFGKNIRALENASFDIKNAGQKILIQTNGEVANIKSRIAFRSGALETARLMIESSDYKKILSKKVEHDKKVSELEKYTQSLSEKLNEFARNPLDNALLEEIQQIKKNIDDTVHKSKIILLDVKYKNIEIYINHVSDLKPWQSEKERDMYEPILKDMQDALAFVTQVKNSENNLEKTTQSTSKSVNDAKALSEVTHARAKSQTDVNKILKNITSPHAISGRYDSTKTNSWSEKKMFGKAVFQSARRPPQMEAIQFVISDIATNSKLDIDEKAILVHALCSRMRDNIREVHPRSRLAHVMEQMVNDINSSKILAKDNKKNGTQPHNKMLDDYLSKIDRTKLSGRALEELSAMESVKDKASKAKKM